MGRVHTEAVRRLGSVEPIAIGGRDEAAFRAALANPGIKAVHICTPNAAHFATAKAALEAGKHVLCEKPLATSAADAQTLVALATEKGLRNCTCHNLRYYPMVQHMRRMREDGNLGEILIVQGTYSQDWLLYDTDWNWRIDSKVSGHRARWPISDRNGATWRSTSPDSGSLLSARISRRFTNSAIPKISAQ